jgi:hypothetical protein
LLRRVALRPDGEPAPAVSPPVEVAAASR